MINYNNVQYPNILDYLIIKYSTINLLKYLFKNDYIYLLDQLCI